MGFCWLVGLVWFDLVFLNKKKTFFFFVQAEFTLSAYYFLKKVKEGRKEGKVKTKSVF